MDVSFVPAVPNGDLLPISGPIHLEMAECATLENLHPVGFYSDLGVGSPGPCTQLLFCIFFSYDHDVKGLCGPEIAYGHLM